MDFLLLNACSPNMHAPTFSHLLAQVGTSFSEFLCSGGRALPSHTSVAEEPWPRVSWSLSFSGHHHRRSVWRNECWRTEVANLASWIRSVHPTSWQAGAIGPHCPLLGIGFAQEQAKLSFQYAGSPITGTIGIRILWAGLSSSTMGSRTEMGRSMKTTWTSWFFR